MLLFDSVVFGAFVGFLTDFWLGRLGFRREPARVVIAVVIGVLVGFFVFFKQLNVF